MFFICSFVGWINEVCIKLFKSNRFVYKGSLHLPLLPIYGVGAIIIVMLFRKHKKHPVILFFLISILMGIFEYLCGLIIDKYFHKELWDYSNRLLNINGYVCLYSVLFFGIGGLLLLYLFIPVYEKIFNKVNIKILNTISVILTIALIVDIFCKLLL